MSISPWFNDYCYLPRPSRLLDQHFGLGVDPDDLWSAFSLPRDLRSLMTWPNYYRPWCTSASTGDAGSTVKVDDGKFVVNLDVQQFTPDEIAVKITGDNQITIEGKHEEREDQHGFISRRFLRRYVLPTGHDVNRVESKLSSDGILTIIAPKCDESIEYRTVPITQTGQPSKAGVDKKSLEKGDVK